MRLGMHDNAVMITTGRLIGEREGHGVCDAGVACGHPGARAWPVKVCRRVAKLGWAGHALAAA